MGDSSSTRPEVRMQLEASSAPSNLKRIDDERTNTSHHPSLNHASPPGQVIDTAELQSLLQEVKHTLQRVESNAALSDQRVGLLESDVERLREEQRGRDTPTIMQPSAGAARAAIKARFDKDPAVFISELQDPNVAVSKEYFAHKKEVQQHEWIRSCGKLSTTYSRKRLWNANALSFTYGSELEKLSSHLVRRGEQLLKTLHMEQVSNDTLINDLSMFLAETTYTLAGALYEASAQHVADAVIDMTHQSNSQLTELKKQGAGELSVSTIKETLSPHEGGMPIKMAEDGSPMSVVTDALLKAKRVDITVKTFLRKVERARSYKYWPRDGRANAESQGESSGQDRGDDSGASRGKGSGGRWTNRRR